MAVAQGACWLVTREGEQRFGARRVKTEKVRGTGCTRSAALAALLPRHRRWGEPVNEAKASLSASPAHADTFVLVMGIGPAHHFPSFV
ncbi:bifunctional hydroxymethylpyrimidine kinase/phosphomethylpyrimidine kinase [Salmonella enterica]|uniref:bifunctional hydroxymethylpyrimidine kinase/phosphomethylpyrimidine kinase n=1 Tax=Salmonella enterica TaxID=28901 RepID=UPI00398C75BD